MADSRGRLPSQWVVTVAIVVAVVGVALVGGRGGSDEAPAEATVVQLDELPPEVGDTIDRIETNGPFPYPEDGAVFGNREGLLPEQESGYYREYTVEIPGSSDRGPRRVVTGEGGEFYYTDDHYVSFAEVDVG